MIEPNAAYGQISSGQSCANVVTSRFPAVRLPCLDGSLVGFP